MGSVTVAVVTVVTSVAVVTAIVSVTAVTVIASVAVVTVAASGAVVIVVAVVTIIASVAVVSIVASVAVVAAGSLHVRQETWNSTLSKKRQDNPTVNRGRQTPHLQATACDDVITQGWGGG